MAKPKVSKKLEEEAKKRRMGILVSEDVGSGKSKRGSVTVAKVTEHPTGAKHSYVVSSDNPKKTSPNDVPYQRGSGTSKKGKVTVTRDPESGRHRVIFSGNGTSSP